MEYCKSLSLSFCLSNDSHMGWSSEESAVAVGPSATFSVFSAAPVCFALRTRNFKELADGQPLSRAPGLSNLAQFHLISKKVCKRKVFFLSLSCCDLTHSTAEGLTWSKWAKKWGHCLPCLQAALSMCLRSASNNEPAWVDFLLYIYLTVISHQSLPANPTNIPKKVSRRKTQAWKLLWECELFLFIVSKKDSKSGIGFFFSVVKRPA